MPKISVAVPTHYFDGNSFFFRRLLDSLWSQTFQDFEVVVTDNSDNNIIEDICNYYKTGIRYHKNPIKGMAQNTNEAIRQSRGSIIKILYMDDYLMNDKVLQKLWSNFDSGWAIMGSSNNPSPEMTSDIHTGNNKLGSPSSLAIENKDPLMFDENLTWLLDCDLYKRLDERYGSPTIINGRCIGIGLGEHQLTHQIGGDVKIYEYEYMNKKYA